jgi:hypothetical protein
MTISILMILFRCHFVRSFRDNPSCGFDLLE